MKTGMLKCMMGLAMTLTATGAFAVGGGQIGSADETTRVDSSTYRNMNIPVTQCKVSAATKAEVEKTGNNVTDEFSIVIDFEDAMKMAEAKTLTVRAFVVTSSKDAGMATVTTGSVKSTKGMKTLVFTSDLIKYNHKYITQQVITFDQKTSKAVVVSNNMVDKSSTVDGTYDCKSVGDQ